MLLAFIASVLSIRTGVSVALLEIAMGVIAGNVLGIHTTDWINFLATFGAGLLTFLAGAEIDPQSLRLHLRGPSSSASSLSWYRFSLPGASRIGWCAGPITGR